MAKIRPAQKRKSSPHLLKINGLLVQQSAIAALPCAAFYKLKRSKTKDVTLPESDSTNEAAMPGAIPGLDLVAATQSLRRYAEAKGTPLDELAKRAGRALEGSMGAPRQSSLSQSDIASLVKNDADAHTCG